ncbi:MAG: hypothetical protein R3E44_10380 [Paracoccaceae bacterium]
MSSSPRLILLLPLLAACTATAPDCTRAERRELATIDRLIADTRANLERGYVMERRGADTSVNFCLGSRRSNVGISFCSDPGGSRHPVAVDQTSEERKLAGLQARRDALMSEISAKDSACRKSG